MLRRHRRSIISSLENISKRTIRLRRIKKNEAKRYLLRSSRSNYPTHPSSLGCLRGRNNQQLLKSPNGDNVESRSKRASVARRPLDDRICKLRLFWLWYIGDGARAASRRVATEASTSTFGKARVRRVRAALRPSVCGCAQRGRVIGFAGGGGRGYLSAGAVCAAPRRRAVEGWRCQGDRAIAP